MRRIGFELVESRDLLAVGVASMLTVEITGDARSTSNYNPYITVDYVESAQLRPAEFKPAEFKPAEFKPAEFKPAEFKPAEFIDAALSDEIHIRLA